MELQFDESTAASFAANAIYKFEQNTETFVTSRPTLMDPLDHRNVYIGRSGIEGSGEGMFARRDILPGKGEHGRFLQLGIELYRLVRLVAD